MSKVETPTRLNSEQVVLALLEANRELGCCQEVFRSVRQALPVRRAVLEQLATPTITIFTRRIDYDHPGYRQPKLDTFDHIDDGLSSSHLAYERTGCDDVDFAEIHIGLSLNIACQHRLMALLGLRPNCYDETGQLIDEQFKDVAHSLMGHCGPSFVATPETPNVWPMYHRHNKQRLLKANRSNFNYDGQYRLLAAVA